MSFKIVSDSSIDMFELADVNYTTVPLKVMFNSVEYVDQPGVNCEQMMHDLAECKGPSTTSCPNVQEWLDAFEGHDGVFGITISSGLSASYEAAVLATKQFLEAHPGARGHIFDSHATGPVLRLIAEKLQEGIKAGKTFEQIRDATVEYQQRIRILYSLESLGNLARNGRVNAHVARIASALNIRIIGHADAEGKIELLHTCRGEKRALRTIVQEMAERGFENGKAYIDHCLNLPAAEKLKAQILERFPDASVCINPTTALCSYYADRGGLILGYDVKA